MSYIFGYTNFIDGSARGVVPPTNVFYQMKTSSARICRWSAWCAHLPLRSACAAGE
jgi:hypothetical protein